MEHERPQGLIDLAHPGLGTRVVFASDEFFAPKERLIAPEEPVFIPGKYDDHGKWMDGWETRRRRDRGFDYCIVRLGRPGLAMHVDIDTRHFTGNFPPAASIDACVCSSDLPDANAVWTNLVPATQLAGNSHHLLTISNPGPWSHLRLNIFPDGGVARLRVYGRVVPDWTGQDSSKPADLASVLNGARPVACSDEHFGRLANILWPGRAATMGDGWETRRRRMPGFDWGIIELGAAGRIEEILVDTSHFKGNYPDRCSLQAIGAADVPDAALTAQSQFWPMLMHEQKLQMDREHVFRAEILPHDPVKFVRFNIIPDGGVSRLRLYGRRG